MRNTSVLSVDVTYLPNLLNLEVVMESLFNRSSWELFSFTSMALAETSQIIMLTLNYNNTEQYRTIHPFST